MQAVDDLMRPVLRSLGHADFSEFQSIDYANTNPAGGLSVRRLVRRLPRVPTQV